eukprot:14704625-Ditylum_brightwellii.AAC.1
MAKWEPALDEYKCEEQYDITPKEWIMAIEKFHLSNNHTLPDKKDTATQCHSENPAVKQTACRLYRYDTWDQLWHEFRKAEPGTNAVNCGSKGAIKAISPIVNNNILPTTEEGNKDEGIHTVDDRDDNESDGSDTNLCGNQSESKDSMSASLESEDEDSNNIELEKDKKADEKLLCIYGIIGKTTKYD